MNKEVEKSEIFEKLELFANIDSDRIRKHILNRNIITKEYSKGASIYNQNEKCNTLDIVLSGSVIVHALSENGSAMTIFEFKKSSVLGANLLFGEENKYPMNLYCADKCKILHIKKEAIIEFLHEYSFAIHFIKSISQKAWGMNQKITMFSQRTLRENVEEYFRQLVIIQGSKQILLPLSKKELADYFGVQRPSLFRELKKMKEEKLILVNNRVITVNFE